MQSNRTIWIIVLSAVLFFGVAVVTLRAAEQAATAGPMALPETRGELAPRVTASPPAPTKQHPPPSAPEESATISDDPTTAPDPSQSADNNVSFPTDI